MNKATVFDIKRFAIHDGDGIRTTVFFKGCPLKCVWCHNPEGISGRAELGFYAHKCTACGACVAACPEGCHRIENGIHLFDREKCKACGRCEAVCGVGALKLYGREYTADELLPILLEDRAFYEESGGGVTLSGGECLMHADFCRELLEKLKANNISTAVDTSGFVSRAAIDKVFPFTDVFLYDVKAYDSEVHRLATGFPNAVILDNLRYINERGGKVEIRIPYVPEHNAADIENIARYLCELSCITKVKVLPYHNYASNKYAALAMENTLPEIIPDEEQIARAEAVIADVLSKRN